MKVIRNDTEFKIKLPPYKIHIKEIKNKNSNSYQYTCILPPLLCSYFNIHKDTITEDEPNTIIFFTYNNREYITSMETLTTFNTISFKQHELKRVTEMCKINGWEIPEESIKDLSELPTINYNIHDNIDHYYFTTAYNLANSNSFRFTLPNKLFKDKIDITKNNYLLFTINPVAKDVLNYHGVISVDVLQELKEDD